METSEIIVQLRKDHLEAFGHVKTWTRSTVKENGSNDGQHVVSVYVEKVEYAFVE